tara:strand:+ start:1822 stop:2046 length:225 start_codon:yes stop_codon:yes gene_type:complete
MDFLTKFEKIRVLATRATQISNGAPSTVCIIGLTTAMQIAQKEFDEKKIPIRIHRKYPNGTIKIISVSSLNYDL